MKKKKKKEEEKKIEQNKKILTEEKQTESNDTILEGMEIIKISYFNDSKTIYTTINLKLFPGKILPLENSPKFKSFNCLRQKNDVYKNFIVLTGAEPEDLTNLYKNNKPPLMIPFIDDAIYEEYSKIENVKPEVKSEVKPEVKPEAKVISNKIGGKTQARMKRRTRRTRRRAKRTKRKTRRTRIRIKRRSRVKMRGKTRTN